MKLRMRTNFSIQYSKDIRSTTKRINKILDAKYEKANLKEITNIFKYLNSNKHLLIYRLLKKHENMFGDTLGNFTGTEYKIELLEGAEQYHVKKLSIPKVHEVTLTTTINRLVNKNNSEWAAPKFMIP